MILGCGTGGNLAELDRLGQARGVDLDALCVDYTRGRGFLGREPLAPRRAVSDVRPTPRPLNALLLSLLRAEKQLLRFTDLPFGVALFAVARKRAATTRGGAGSPTASPVHPGSRA